MPHFFAVLLCVLGLFVVYIFNKLVRERNACKAAWSDVNVQLIRRHNLIPNLIDIVKGYSEFEKSSQELMSLLRKQTTGLSTESTTQLEQHLSNNLNKINVLVEAYPDLKASATYSQLMNELVETEDDIQHARRYFNGTVNKYNTSIQSFPDLLLAKLLSFEANHFFEFKNSLSFKGKVK